MALRLGPCLFCVSSSLGGSTSLCPFGLGLLALRGGGSLPSLGSAFLTAGTDTPCSSPSSVGDEADGSPPAPSFRFLLKDRPLNLEGFLKENFFFFLGVSLAGGWGGRGKLPLDLRALARGFQLDGIASGPGFLLCSVHRVGANPLYLWGISLHCFSRGHSPIH